MDATYDLHARVLKVLADRRLLEIIHLLGTGPRNASRIASAIGSDEGTVHLHLSALIDAGLVEPRQSNGTVRYGLSDPEVRDACELMRGVLRRQIERLARRERPGSPPAQAASGAESGRREGRS